MNSEILLVEQLDDATSLLTLNRPERRNALTIALMEAVCGALDKLAAQPHQRVVILRGAGPATKRPRVWPRSLNIANRSGTRNR